MENLNLRVLMNELIKVREAIDQVEAKGHGNRSLLVFAFNTCNDVLKQLGKAYEEEQKEKTNDNSDGFT